MRIGMKLTGLDALLARVTGMRERVQNPQPGLLRAAMVFLKAAKERITFGGPGWPPNESGTPLLWRSGRLINSLQVGSPGNVMDYSGDTVRVGTNVPYARYLQEGTGIYGERGQPITPTSGKALAFEVNGVRYIRRSVKGVQPRKFLFIDDDTARTVVNVWRTYILGGVSDE